MPQSDIIEKPYAVDQGVEVGAEMTEDGEGVAIVTVQGVLGAEPEKALRVLNDSTDNAVGKAISKRRIGEAAYA